ncbi:MAG: SRPBCC family protein [Myxococcota bacterium]
MKFTNVHERFVEGSPQQAKALLDTLATGEDALWPRGWPPIRLDRELGVGAAGGHGPIRYSVEGYQPGRSVTFRFEPSTGFEGNHWIEIAPGVGGVFFRHVIHAESGFWGRLYWSLIVRPLHDALIEDAFDNAERAITGAVARPARWSLRVRALRSILSRVVA